MREAASETAGGELEKVERGGDGGVAVGKEAREEWEN